MLSVTMAAATQLEGLVQDFFGLLFGVWFLLFVDRAVRSYFVDQRFRNPSSTKGMPQKAAELGYSRRLRGVGQSGHSVNFERFKKVHIEILGREDTLALAVILQPPEE